MSDAGNADKNQKPIEVAPSEEFAAYSEAEFERRLNSGEFFDEQRYRQAMQLVVEKLRRLEEGSRT